jgi:hypothetical protein
MFVNSKSSGARRALRPCRKTCSDGYRPYARFIQPDPLGYDDGMNMYGYVGGDPVNFTDPTGLDRQCVSWRGPGSVTTDSKGTIIVTRGEMQEGCWGTEDRGGNGSIDRGGNLFSGIGDALDNFAEKHLKPPEGRRPQETRDQCTTRIAGMSPSLGLVGAFSIGAGGGMAGLPARGLWRWWSGNIADIVCGERFARQRSLGWSDFRDR